MRPEVWARIRRDWKESLPAVIGGYDDQVYEDGWALKDLPPPSIVNYARYCASVMGISPGELLGESRKQWLARKRQLVYLLCHERFPKVAYYKIAKALGRDHTTVSHGIDRIRALIRIDPDMRAQYERLKSQL